MTHVSATPYLLWSLQTFLTSAFFVYHIYKFDRLQCFRWSKSAMSANFKRFMIYSYTLTLPCIFTYALGFAIIKMQEGDMILNTTPPTILPKPAFAWSVAHKQAVIPLYLILAIGWALEISTHLEELCFWLFLVHSRKQYDNWFQTIYFKIWAAGSVAAFTLMVTITAWSRNDSLKCEAYTFLAGSTVGLLLTISFIPILFRFPAFLRDLKAEGIDNTTVTRLAKCHELNVIRVCFRFVFLVPFLILSSDGVKPAHAHINENIMAVDFLATTGGFGCAVSSVITILIFFPRDFQAEVDRDYERVQKKMASRASTTRRGTDPHSKSNLHANRATDHRGSYLITGSPVSEFPRLADLENGDVVPSPIGLHPLAEYDEDAEQLSIIEPSVKDWEREPDYVGKAPPLASNNQRHSRMRMTSSAPAQTGYAPSATANNKSPSTGSNPFSKARSDDIHSARDLSFPLTSHNLALHTSLERTRGGPNGTNSRPSRPSIYSFRSPIDMLS